MGNLLVGALALVAAFLPSTLGYTAFGWAKDKGKSNFKSGLWGASAAIGSGIVAYFTLGAALMASGKLNNSVEGLGQIPAVKNKWLRAAMNTQTSISWPYRAVSGVGQYRTMTPVRAGYRTPWRPYIEGLGQARPAPYKYGYKYQPHAGYSVPWPPWGRVAGLGQTKTRPVRRYFQARQWKPYIEGLGLIAARRKRGVGLIDVSRRRVSGLGRLGRPCVGC